MNITPLFPTFLAESDTTNIVDLTLIEQYCESINYDNSLLDPYSLAMLPLTSWINEQVINIKKIQGIKENVNVSLRECWVNFIESDGERLSHPNFPHSHPNNWISFVYYIKCLPDSGNLVLVPPHQTAELTIPREYINEHTIHNAARWSVYPYPGLAVAFPSYLTHFVEPNHSKAPRISIAYNFNLPYQILDK